MIYPALYSRAPGSDDWPTRSDDWPTPQWLFRQLDRRFHFTLDPCATAQNAKCPIFFTEKDDGLKQDWGTHRAFVNCPWGRGRIAPWATKCWEASQAGAFVVLLVPAHTDTKWFHERVAGKAKVEFLRKQVKFTSPETGRDFATRVMLVIYSPQRAATTCARCGRAFIGRSDARACSDACQKWLQRHRNVHPIGRTAEVKHQNK